MYAALDGDSGRPAVEDLNMLHEESKPVGRHLLDRLCAEAEKDSKDEKTGADCGAPF